MKCFDLKENVDVIISLNEYFFLGSYDLKDGEKKGSIRKLRLSNLDLQDTSSVMTSGTFDLKARGSNILSANTKDITIYDKDLKVIKYIPTDTYNTFISQNDSLICISDGDGYVTFYDENFDIISKLKISKDILWVVEVHGDYVYCGGEDGVLYIIDLKTYSLQNTLLIGCGITSLYFENDFFLLGSYDENIYKISYDLEIKQTTKVGGGVWRIRKKEENHVVSCMYDGVKILNGELQVLKTYEKVPLIYSLALYNDFIIFNSFYEKKLYVV